MLQSVEGIYREGTIELLETPAEVQESRVIVTFLSNVKNAESDGEAKGVNLRCLSVSREETAELRHKFSTFEDWNDPAMDIYDDYDAAKNALDEQI